MPKYADQLEKVSSYNIDSRIFSDTQEDFVFRRERAAKKKPEPVAMEERGSLLENWLEVKRILMGGT
jgi:hypothetical protein